MVREYCPIPRNSPLQPPAKVQEYLGRGAGVPPLPIVDMNGGGPGSTPGVRTVQKVFLFPSHRSVNLFLSKIIHKNNLSFFFEFAAKHSRKFSLSSFRCYLFNSHPETHVRIPEPGSESNSDVVHAHTRIFEILRCGNPGFDSPAFECAVHCDPFSLLHAFFYFTPTDLSNFPGQVRPAVLHSLSSSAVFMLYSIPSDKPYCRV
jgi:hypothetical protein